MTSFAQLDSTQTAPTPTVDAAEQALYLDGVADGAHGDKPSRNEEAYVLGYAEGIRRTRNQGIGRIQWRRPTDHFAFGYLDGIGNGTDGERNIEF